MRSPTAGSSAASLLILWHSDSISGHMASALHYCLVSNTLWSGYACISLRAYPSATALQWLALPRSNPVPVTVRSRLLHTIQMLKSESVPPIDTFSSADVNVDVLHADSGEAHSE